MSYNKNKVGSQVSPHGFLPLHQQGCASDGMVRVLGNQMFRPVKERYTNKIVCEKIKSSEAMILKVMNDHLLPSVAFV